jgi:glyoxylase-like metal-dependent hydrolase (beta-lactamase superfamily II)
MKSVRRFGGGAVILLALLFLRAAVRQQMPPGTEHEGQAFAFTKIAEGVYHAVGTGSMSVGANSVIVVNDTDVLLVDSHVSPAAAAVLLQEMKQITDKPVRYVVDTHFHFDHAHRNQIFGPEVQIIGTEFTREMLASGKSVAAPSYPRFVGVIPQQIAALRAQLDTARAADNRAALERRIRIQESYRVATAATRPTPPTVTFNRRLTLNRGGREIRIEFFGRGHTGGDAVVYLPRERILMTGDLVSTGTSFMGDGYAPDWVDTIERLKELDFQVVLPGHGPPFRERERLDWWQAYLRDFWAQASRLHREGVSAEEAARRIDLRAHASHYPAITAVGADRDAVNAAYGLLAGTR